MSENINVTDQVNVSVEPNTTNISVSNVGVQGPSGDSGVGGSGTSTSIVGLTTSGELESTGTALQNQVDSISTASVVGLTTSGELENTGTALQAQIDSIDIPSVDGLATSGNLETTGTQIVSLLDNYYPTSNPNDFIRSGDTTTADTSGLATSGNVESTGTALQIQIDAIDVPSVVGLSNSGELETTGTQIVTLLDNYYTTSNPNNFIRSGDIESTDISGLSSSGNVESTGTALQDQIDTLDIPSVAGLISTGDVNDISGSLQEHIEFSGGYLLGLINASSAGVSSINSASGAMTLVGAGDVYVTTAGQTITVSGDIESTGTALQNQLGNYYLDSNPNNFLRSGDETGGDTSGLSTSGNVENTGTALQNQIDAIPSYNLNGLSTSGNLESTGTSLQNQIDAISVPSVVGLSTSGDLESTGTALQDQIAALPTYNLNGLTTSGELESTGTQIIGALSDYYLASNPSNYTSDDLNGLTTSGELETTGTALQDQINALSIPSTVGLLSSGDHETYSGSLDSYIEETGTALQNQINNISASSAPYTIDGSGEIWIAPRTDGVSGSGTLYNPYDGSTSEKLIDIFNDKAGSGSKMNFLPGQYYLEASNPTAFSSGSWSPLSRWELKGAGIDRTIITMTGYENFPAGRHCLFSSFDPTIENFNISDMTLDGGPQVSGVCTCFVDIHGRNNSARRVKLINFGNSGVPFGVESFGIILTAYYNQKNEASNCVIEDCIGVQPWTKNTDGQTIFVIAPYNTQTGDGSQFTIDRSADTSNVIRGCYVDLSPYGLGSHSSQFGYNHAFTAPVIENNFARGVEVGAYFDTHSDNNLIIRNNHFIDVQYGMDMNFYTQGYIKQNVVFENNHIELTDKDLRFNNIVHRGARILGKASRPNTTFENIKVKGNTVTLHSGSMNTGIHYHGFSIYNANNVLVEDNIIADFGLNPSPNSGVHIWTGLIDNLVKHNNYSTGLNPLEDSSSTYYQASNPNNFISTGDVNDISGSLQEHIEFSGGYLLGLINASSAGVSSINGESGALTLNGAGDIQVETNGTTITISGTGDYYQNIDEQRVMTEIPSGSGTLIITYNSPFSEEPMIWTQVKTTGDILYYVNSTIVENNKYTVIFSDTITESGLYLQSLIKKV